jgi:mannose-6-phosphate isomerase-like protein (cupin superfamily)
MDGIRLLTAGAGVTILAAPPRDPYYYACHRLGAGESFSLPDLDMISVFVSPHHSANVNITNGEITLSPSDSWHGENYPPAEWHANGDVVALVAGMKTNVTEPKSHVTRANEYYRVTKPWGHELWLNGENPHFVFKEVHIKQGNQTSLQYHHFKEETSLLLVGETTLVYKRAANVDNDNVSGADLAEKHLPPGTAVEVKPPALHRLRAVTDIYSYEVTTPFNDDIIRVSDDAGRPNGRIQSEHQKLPLSLEGEGRFA